MMQAGLVLVLVKEIVAADNYRPAVERGKNIQCRFLDSQKFWWYIWCYLLFSN